MKTARDPAIICGEEQELGFAAFLGGRRVSEDDIYPAFLENARRFGIPNEGWHGGVFVANGGSIYRDAARGGARARGGQHLEFASAECTNPRDLRLQVRGMEKLMLDILDRTLESMPGGDGIRASFLRTNCDPAAAASWGTHLNIQSSAHPDDFEHNGLVPHLVTKMLLGGEGGFVPRSDPLKPGEPTYLLSPRMFHFGGHVTGGNSESARERPLICTKGDRHSLHHHRLHLIGFACLLSDRAHMLDRGSTMLVARVAELTRGAAFSKFALDSPADALRVVNWDPSLRALINLRNGAQMSALDIQEAYADACERHLDQLPPWAGAFLQDWKSALQDLRHGWERAMYLQWPLKRMIFETQGAFTLPNEPALLALDMKYGAYGRHETGVFDQMAAAGCLPDGQLLLDETEVHRARITPPQDTRAKLRGDAISEIIIQGPLRRGDGSHASWTSVFDAHRNAALDLGQTQCLTPHWRPVFKDSPKSLLESSQSYPPMRLYELGRYTEALAELDSQYPDNDHARSQRVWILARLGRASEAIETLDEHSLHMTDELLLSIDHLLVSRFLGFGPRPEAPLWIRVGGNADSRRSAVFASGAGAALLRMGELDAAEQKLRMAAGSLACTRIGARARCDLARCLAMKGALEPGFSKVVEAASVLESRGFFGDWAEFGLPTLARLAHMRGERSLALDALKRSRVMLAAFEARTALLRVRVLEARIRGVMDNEADSVFDAVNGLLSGDVPSCHASDPGLLVLEDCWAQWVSGEPLPDALHSKLPAARHDPCFWGL
ncbi:MAG TPA: hypothetical protein DIT13_09810 [Verrucomicrobiales bacterium]|nr:hypothetical protein [Verrucomicrobiales bacterium]HRJ07330.1 proteasome accessory factor PafA2 family protein [Prosthecobacter sp.]HRK15434.1 proteasome accessory factor PafA2 family protein [Prosthecobacter sp.]